MSFDKDPDDKYERILCNHPESDCLFEVFSRAEFAEYNRSEQVDDVTGIPHWEEMFRKQEFRKKFDEKLKDFDNTFEFSEDSKYYNAGKAQLLILQGIAVQCGMSKEEFEQLTGHKL